MALNKIPNFNDPVLPTRFVKLAFEVSFLGREDNQLSERLLSELPGIAVRCLAAYRRACERGRLINLAPPLPWRRSLRSLPIPTPSLCRKPSSLTRRGP